MYRQGIILLKQGKTNDAITIFDAVLAVEPKHAVALHYRGLAELILKNNDKARFYLERALQIDDSNATCWNNYGVALKELQRYEESKEAFRSAVQLKPKYADAWANLGELLRATNEDDQRVEKALKTAIILAPLHREAPLHLADHYLDRQENHKAKRVLQTYLNHFPENIPAMQKMVTAMIGCKDYEEALNLAQNFPLDEQEKPETKLLFGRIFGELGRLEESKHHYRTAAAQHDKKHVFEWKYLGYCPVLFENENAIEDYWQFLNTELDKAIESKLKYSWRYLPYEGFIPSFNLPHLNRCCREVKEKFATIFMPFFSLPPLEPRREIKYGGKIRVGFLVTYGHEGGFIRTQGSIVKRLDPSHFETYLIYDKRSSKRIQREFASASHLQHLAYGRNFSQAVEQIRHAMFDIVSYWKVGGDSWNQFFAMARLAPIQCTEWGTHGTSGVSSVDYYLSDKNTEIELAQEHYTEKLELLATTPLFEKLVNMPKDVSRDDFGLPANGAVYFCPHRLPKYYPSFDFYLKEILESDSSGHIALLSDDIPYWDEYFKNRLRIALGESLFSRLIFFSKLPVQRYYKLLSLATVVLESPVYSGGNTGFDSLAFGIPCVTQSGTLLIQRYSHALYERMQIYEMLVHNKNEYVANAARLGKETDFRRHVSEKIIESQKIIFEDATAIKEYERFFLTAAKSLY